MNQIALTFTETRARRGDCSTSKAAAKAAVTRKADGERIAITAAVKAAPGGLTAPEIAEITGLGYFVVQRRKSECGLVETDEKRGGNFRVWRAS